MNRRYERKSRIVTTNRPFKEWNEVFPNATCIATLLDRLLHHADVTLIEGDSYPLRESEQEARRARGKRETFATPRTSPSCTRPAWDARSRSGFPAGKAEVKVIEPTVGPAK